MEGEVVVGDGEGGGEGVVGNDEREERWYAVMEGGLGW